MIEAHHLTKEFGSKRAVDDLTITVRPGLVTGFLGPNGAGKSTTMRLIIGLDRPTSGRVTVNGRNYASMKAPLQEVGALLDAKATHPGRSARSHLRALAATHGISNRRVNDVIEMAGLQAVATKRIGSYSLGMGQRLGIAAALLGDPGTLILDEPVNGLDPEGVAWIRHLVKYLAAEGRTVFLSSHLMSEMAQTADHLIILGKGKLIANSSTSELIAQVSGTVTQVRSPQADQIARFFSDYGFSSEVTEPGVVLVHDLTPSEIGEYASGYGWTIHELNAVQRSLEEAYLELTDQSTEFAFQGLEPVPTAPTAPPAASVAEVMNRPRGYEPQDYRPAAVAGRPVPDPGPAAAWGPAEGAKEVVPIAPAKEEVAKTGEFWRSYAARPATESRFGEVSPTAMAAIDPAWPSIDDVFSTLNLPAAAGGLRPATGAPFLPGAGLRPPLPDLPPAEAGGPGLPGVGEVPNIGVAPGGFPWSDRVAAELAGQAGAYGGPGYGNPGYGNPGYDPAYPAGQDPWGADYAASAYAGQAGIGLAGGRPELYINPPYQPGQSSSPQAAAIMDRIRHIIDEPWEPPAGNLLNPVPQIPSRREEAWPVAAPLAWEKPASPWHPGAATPWEDHSPPPMAWEDSSYPSGYQGPSGRGSDLAGPPLWEDSRSLYPDRSPAASDYRSGYLDSRPLDYATDRSTGYTGADRGYSSPHSSTPALASVENESVLSSRPALGYSSSDWGYAGSSALTALPPVGSSTSALSSLGLGPSGLSGLPTPGLSSLGLPSSGLSSLGLPSSGLSSPGLPSSGLSSLGLPSSSALAPYPALPPTTWPAEPEPALPGLADFDVAGLGASYFDSIPRPRSATAATSRSAWEESSPITAKPLPETPAWQPDPNDPWPAAAAVGASLARDPALVAPPGHDMASTMVAAAPTSVLPPVPSRPSRAATPPPAPAPSVAPALPAPALVSPVLAPVSTPLPDLAPAPVPLPASPAGHNPTWLSGSATTAAPVAEPLQPNPPKRRPQRRSQSTSTTTVPAELRSRPPMAPPIGTDQVAQPPAVPEPARPPMAPPISTEQPSPAPVEPVNFPAPVPTGPIPLPPRAPAEIPLPPRTEPPVTAPAYPDQPAYSDQPVYSDQPAYSDQPVYSGQPVYPDQLVYSGQPAYSDQPIYPGQPVVYADPGQPVYSDPGQPFYPGPPAAFYPGQPYPGQPAAPAYPGPGQPVLPSAYLGLPQDSADDRLARLTQPRPAPLVPAPPGTIPTSSVVPDVESTGSLTPLLDQLLFDPDVAASSPSRRGFQSLPSSGRSSASASTGEHRFGDATLTQASLRRLWQKSDQS